MANETSKNNEINENVNKCSIFHSILEGIGVLQKSHALWLTFFAVFFTSIIAIANFVLGYYTLRANNRAEKLFVGQNKPLIDVTPIGITQLEDPQKGKHCVTLFRIANYSGFLAKYIVIDLRYGKDNNWISEWLKAETDRKKKEEEKVEEKGVIIGQFYHSTAYTKSGLFIEILKPGETKEKENVLIFVGLLDLEKTVCNAGYDGHPVFVRVKWENEKGHVFDEIHNYKLLCTKSVAGRSFTFIPEGIISHKGKK